MSETTVLGNKSKDCFAAAIAEKDKKGLVTFECIRSERKKGTVHRATVVLMDASSCVDAEDNCDKIDSGRSESAAVAGSMFALARDDETTAADPALLVVRVSGINAERARNKAKSGMGGDHAVSMPSTCILVWLCPCELTRARAPRRGCDVYSAAPRHDCRMKCCGTVTKSEPRLIAAADTATTVAVDDAGERAMRPISISDRTRLDNE